MHEEESPFACDMSAISEERRAEHQERIESLFQAVETVIERENGYSFRLTNAAGVLVNAAAFIELERLCCPFFGFDLEVEPEACAIWLTINGREGVKPFILAEIGHHLSVQIEP